MHTVLIREVAWKKKLVEGCFTCTPVAYDYSTSVVCILSTNKKRRYHITLTFFQYGKHNDFWHSVGTVSRLACFTHFWRGMLAISFLYYSTDLFILKILITRE